MLILYICVLFTDEPRSVANRRAQSHEEVLGGRLAATTSFTVNRMGKQQEEKLIGECYLFFSTDLISTGCLCHKGIRNHVSSVFSPLPLELLKSFLFFSHSLGHILNIMKQIKSNYKKKRKRNIIRN